MCQTFCRGVSPDLTPENLSDAGAQLARHFPKATARMEKEYEMDLSALMAREEVRSWDLSFRRESHQDGHTWHVARGPNGIDHRRETCLIIAVRLGTPVSVVV